jgi:hypothetical protein
MPSVQQTPRPSVEIIFPIIPTPVKPQSYRRNEKFARPFFPCLSVALPEACGSKPVFLCPRMNVARSLNAAPYLFDFFDFAVILKKSSNYADFHE